MLRIDMLLACLKRHPFIKCVVNELIPTTVYYHGWDFFVGTTARMFVKFMQARLLLQIKWATAGLPPDIF